MHIRQVHLSSFKRFGELTITGLPISAQLVVLAGPNGTGKSSIFEGMNAWRRSKASIAHPTDTTYFGKVGAAPVDFQQYVAVEFHEQIPANPAEVRKAIWVRSAYRHDPDFTIQSLTKQTPMLDEPGIGRLIDAEQSVGRNYQRLVAATVASVYDLTKGDLTVHEVRQRLIGRLQSEITTVFPDLSLEGPGNPLADGTFFFTKGTSKNFRYLNLSAGEKAAFDLLLDLLLRIEEYDNTVFCVDEPELHIGTVTQRRLLQSFMTLLPNTCQLWLATHSIGMMRAARDVGLAEPGTVCFLDMANLDLDAAIVIEPIVADRQFWQRVLTVALDDLAELVAPETVVLCEGHPSSEWDARCLRAIFRSHHAEAEFVSVGNAHDVQGDRAGIGAAVTALVPGTKVIRVRDRDEMTTTEVADVEAQGCRVLSRRHLESFLLANDVLQELAVELGKPSAGQELIAARDVAISDAVANRGKSPDDYKAVAGAVYNEAKRLFALTSSGGTASAFLAEVVAPILRPGLPSFGALQTDIFG